MMDELLEQFLVEGRELVEQASGDLLVLARLVPSAIAGEAARIDSAFRAVHTLKGSVGLFDFAPMGVALHTAEDLMGALRDGRTASASTAVDAVLDCIGAVDGWIEAIARNGLLPADAAAEAESLQAAMLALLPGPELSVIAAMRPAAEQAAWLPVLLAQADAMAAAAGGSLTAIRYTPDRDCFFRGDDPLGLVRSVPDLVTVHVQPRQPWPMEGRPDPFACNLIIECLSAAPPEVVRPVFRFVSDQVEIAQVGTARASPAAAPRQPTTASQSAGSGSLRIDAARIDALAGLINELIISTNGLGHLAARASDSAPSLARAMRANHAEIERLVAELHRGVMAARMMTLTQMFGRLGRVVRETAGRLGKQVAFEALGAATEADKTVVDGLYEPLLHVLRNAVDHGVETAAQRTAAGKSFPGRITLEAARAGDQIVVTVTDDGPGIDPARLRQTALTKRLLDSEALAALDDTAVLELAFMPGFSTAATVTNVSGRGVGLDAVRRSVEALAGRVTLSTTRGAGSTVRIAVPQAVAVTKVIMVRAGAELFGVPLDSVVETARIPADELLAVGDGVAFARDGQVIPLLHLADLLACPRENAEAAHAEGNKIKVLIVQNGNNRTAVEVDGIGQRMEAVIRPMAGLLSGIAGLLGTALLGDGSILMVVNLPALLGLLPQRGEPA